MNRGLVVHAAHDVRLDHLAEPTPAADEAVVAIAYGGVCGSDIHYWKDGAAGASILRVPMLLGHEVSGTVLVPAVDGSSPDAGTPVTVHPASPGGRYLGSAALMPHTEGAFADRVALPTRMLRPLPAGVTLRAAALAEPTAVAWHAVAQAGDVRGAATMVVGTGPIGALAVGVLRHHGAASVTAVDVAALPLSLARAMGATATIDVTAEQPPVEAFDVVLEASGTVSGLATAIAAARRGGRVVLVGLQRSGEVPAPLATAITRELHVIGSFRFVDEIDDVLVALAEGSIDVEPVVTHELELADGVAALAVAADGARSGKVLLRF